MYNTMSQVVLEIPLRRIHLGWKIILFMGPSIWSKLSNDLKTLTTAFSFTPKYKNQVLQNLSEYDLILIIVFIIITIIKKKILLLFYFLLSLFLYLYSFLLSLSSFLLPLLSLYLLFKSLLLLLNLSYPLVGMVPRCTLASLLD